MVSQEMHNLRCASPIRLRAAALIFRRARFFGSALVPAGDIRR
jgi:hypothetical protein